MSLSCHSGIFIGLGKLILVHPNIHWHWVLDQTSQKLRRMKHVFMRRCHYCCDLIKRLKYPTPSGGSKHIKVWKRFAMSGFVECVCACVCGGWIAKASCFASQWITVWIDAYKNVQLDYNKERYKSRSANPNIDLGTLSACVSGCKSWIQVLYHHHCFISFISICIGLQEVLQGQLGCIIIIIAVNTIAPVFTTSTSILCLLFYIRLSLITDDVVHILLCQWIKCQIATEWFWGWLSQDSGFVELFRFQTLEGSFAWYLLCSGLDCEQKSWWTHKIRIL